MNRIQFMLSERFSSEEEALRKEAFRSILIEYLSHTYDDPLEDSLGTKSKSLTCD